MKPWSETPRSSIARRLALGEHRLARLGRHRPRAMCRSKSVLGLNSKAISGASKNAGTSRRPCGRGVQHLGRAAALGLAGSPANPPAQPQEVLVERRGLLAVAAAIGVVVQALDHGPMSHAPAAPHVDRKRAERR